MIVGEPQPDYWMLPATVLAGVVAAIILTVTAILTDDRKTAAGIKTQAKLGTVLGRWMARDWTRVSPLSVEWVATATWFGLKVSS
jgi:hypothetical protein